MKWGYGFMERKILIIGNGFDLYHGLPTRYTDFLFFADNWKIFKDEYDKHCKKGEALRGEAIKVRLSERKTLTEESLLDFSIHTDLYCEDHISFLDEHLQNNAWLNFFRENRIPGRNWIDFEAEIERALNQVELFYSEILPSSKNKIPTLNMPVFMKNVISTFSIKAKEAEIGYQTLTNTMFRPNDWDFDSLNRNKTLLLESMKKELRTIPKSASLEVVQQKGQLIQTLEELAGEVVQSSNYRTKKDITSDFSKAEKKIIQAMLEVLTRNFARETVDSLYKEFLSEIKTKGKK